jgi:hypothetical protein
MIKFITHNPELFYYLSDNLKNDKDFLYQAIQINPKIFFYLSDELIFDEEFILKLIEKNEVIIELIPLGLRNNIKFVTKAIKANVDVVYYICDLINYNKYSFIDVIEKSTNDIIEIDIDKLYHSFSDSNDILLAIMDKINFNKSILFYKPIYYHFLDGYLNPNEGSNLEPFIKKFHDELTLNNSNIIIYNKLIESESLEKVISNNLNIYLIFITGHNNHNTSLITFFKENKYYILSFNSGDGIHMHKNNNGKYIPYYGIIIDDYCDFIKTYKLLRLYLKCNKFHDL